MLEQLHKEFEISANRIKDWKELSKYKLAMGYIENESNIEVRDAYFSAFALRY